MKIIVVLLLLVMPTLVQAQKNKKTDDTKVVTTSSETINQSKALFIVDGVRMVPNDSINYLDSINPDNIASVSVLKGEQAILQYGEAGKNGVILITTKTPIKMNPLYILDGVIIKNIDGLNSDDIESIQVLKGKESTSEYGDAGADGVVLITTRSSKKNRQ